MTAVRRGREKRREALAAQEAAAAAEMRARRRSRWRRIALALSAALVLAAVGFAARAPLQRWQTGRQFARAQRLLSAGQDPAAAEELALVLGRTPSHREARLALADLELRRGRIEQGFLHLVAYTELVPEDAGGWVRLADLHATLGQPAEVEATLTHALEAEPGRNGVARRRAEVRLRLGRFRS